MEEIETVYINNIVFLGLLHLDTPHILILSYLKLTLVQIQDKIFVINLEDFTKRSNHYASQMNSKNLYFITL